MKPRARLAATLLAVLAAAGCARALAVESEARPVYRMNVHNETAEPMIVSYDEGRGTALLGTVAPGGTDSFVIAARTTTVAVQARNAAGTRTLGPFSVQLTTTAPAVVRLR